MKENLHISDHWYVLYTKPRHEKKTADILSKMGYEGFCPTIISRRKWSDRIKKVHLPMFPSYIFVKTSEKHRESISKVPGVLKFIFWEGKPAVVKDVEMENIRKVHLQEGTIEIHENDFVQGDEIEIRNGKFKGVKGRIESSGRNYVWLVVEELNLRLVFRTINKIKVE